MTEAAPATNPRNRMCHAKERKKSVCRKQKLSREKVFAADKPTTSTFDVFTSTAEALWAERQSIPENERERTLQSHAGMPTIRRDSRSFRYKPSTAAKSSPRSGKPTSAVGEKN